MNARHRWQSAVNLANSLGNPGPDGKALRQDAALASELSSMLEDEIKEGSTKEQPILLRCFLCKALGEFEVPAGLAALVTAAGTQRACARQKRKLRLAALQAIAMLAENVGRVHPDESLATPEVQEVLNQASHDDDPRIRGTAAFAMGVVGGEKSLARLAVLLADSNADVRLQCRHAVGGPGRRPGNADAVRHSRS